MNRLHVTPVVLNLIIINVLVFIVLNAFGERVIEYFELFKLDWIFPRPFFVTESGIPVGFKPIQILSHFFSHVEIWHIAMNMLVLYSFGTQMEMVLGPKRFLISYLTIGLFSGAMVALFDPSPNPVIGASGALFGIMVLFAYYFPKAKLSIMFLPFQFPVRKFMVGAAILSAGLVVAEYFSQTSMGGISHAGHLAGMIAGFLYLNISKIRTIGKR
jgi:membrane associated rhomboid family serine protease